MRALRLSVAATLAALVSISISSSATAAVPAKDRAEARSLTNEGKKALREKRWTDAIAALKKADKLDPGAVLEVDLAQAQIGAGKLVEAGKTLSAVVAGTEATLTARRAREAAKKMLADVKARTPTVKVTVRGAANGQATARIDCIEVDASAEVAVNPGAHTIGASAEGFASAEKEVQLAEGAHEEVKLKLASERRAPVEEPKPTSGSRVPGAVVTGIGAAGLVVGGIFGGMAITATNQAKSLCTGNVCPPAAADDISRSKLYGNVSTGAFIAGGAVAATGIVLIIVAPGGSSSSKSDDRSARISPWIGPGGAGLGATGRF